MFGSIKFLLCKPVCCIKRFYQNKGWVVKVGLAVIALYFIVVTVLGMLWSREPNAFSVTQNASALAQQRGQKQVPGYTTTTTLLRLSQTLLDKSGGFIHNDRFPPGVFMDNMPNWEYGVLIQVRDLSRAMRKDFSRSQSQSAEDPDLAKAEPRFNYSANSWIFPSSESQYRDGIDRLNAYLNRLAAPQPKAEFYARADNLVSWLDDVSTRLGSLSQRLTASVGQVRSKMDVAQDEQDQTNGSELEVVKTPWTKIDDVFYEARGYNWGLIEVLKAISVDFKQVLRKKGATASLEQIIRELEYTQETLWSPVVLNGGGFGLFANHSLVMASYTSRANAAIIDLRNLLKDG